MGHATVAPPTREPPAVRAPSALARPEVVALGREVEAIGRAHGLDAIGIAPAAPFHRARQALEDRRRAGLHGGMAFTFRNPERSTTPGRLLPGAAAIVVGARRHHSVPPAPAAEDEPVGRVARYAWTDHYRALRESLGFVADHLRQAGHRAVVVADDNALVDREAAYLAGLGWYGKNANLLLPGQGSWFVLGSVVTTAPLVPAAAPVADGCGPCRRCLDGCPTGAIISPGVVDANRCLAWLVQRPGSFPRHLREALGDRIYGCDDCQEVCPPNLAAGRREARAGGDTDADAWVALVELLSTDDATLLARHGRWYIPAREPRWLRRNALVALGNGADPDAADVRAVLARYLVHADPMLRAHAAWACRRLGRPDLLELLAGDPSAEVRDELAAPAPTARLPSGPASGGRRPG